MQDYDWKKDLDEGIWPQPWPDRGSRLSKMNAVFEDNETSKKQKLEYIHIFLFHNKMMQKGCSYPKAVSSRKNSKYWNEYFGYKSDSSNCTVLFRHFQKTKEWRVFQKGRKAFLEQKLKESQPALPMAHVVIIDDIKPASKDDLAQNIADLPISFSPKVHVAADSEDFDNSRCQCL